MADYEGLNTGYLYQEDETTQVAEASAEFVVFQNESIIMTKEADREVGYYYPGDTITFTIRITNTGGLEVEDFFFKDTLDMIIVPISGPDFIVTTTAGTITSKSRTVTIADIDIAAGGSVVITIEGKIS